MKRSLIVAVSMFAAAVAWSADAYRVAWTQDFEDVATYANDLKEGSVASLLLGTNAADAKDLTYTVHQGAFEYVDSGTVKCQISQEDRGGGASSKYLRMVMRGGVSANVLFVMPEEATTATEYIVAFDYYLGPSYTNGDNVSTNGLVIVGGNGTLATLCRKPVSNAASYPISIFKGDSIEAELTHTVNTGARGSYDVAAYWMHVTVRGDASGVYLSVENGDGVGKLAETKISETFDVVTTLYSRCTAKQYCHGSSFDDVSVSLPVSGNYVWTGSAGDGLWSTTANWLVDEYVPAEAPNVNSDVVIPAEMGTVALPCDAPFGTLSLGAGTQLGLLVRGVTESAEVFELPTLADGTVLSADRVVVLGPYEKGISEDGTKITACRVPSDFTWAVRSGDWKVGTNWSVNGAVSGEVPCSEDHVIIDEDAAIDVSGTSMSVTNFTVAAGKKLTVTGDKNLFSACWDGFGGTISLDGGTIGNNVNSRIVMSNDVEVAEGRTGTIISGNVGYYCYTEFYGNLIGAGSLKINEAGRNGSGFVMFGDNRGFSGSLEVINYFTDTSNSLRSNTRFMCASASSSNATWKVRGNATSNIFQESNAVYYFGSLDGTVHQSSVYSGIVLEIGARNVDCAFGGCVSRADDSGHRNYGTRIRKVGTARLSVDTTNTGTVEINGGEFLFMHESALPHVNAYGDYWIQFGGGSLVANGLDVSALVKNSIAPVDVVVEAETNEVWATAIEASNVGGFIKKGEGTLTLAAAPAYSGYTKVVAGALVLPDSTAIDYDVTSSSVPQGAVISNYGMMEGTTVVYNPTAPISQPGKTVKLDGLARIDLTAIDAVSKTDEFVIMQAGAFTLNGGAASRKTLNEGVEVLWKDGLELPCAFDIRLKMVGNGVALVVTRKQLPLIITVR